MENPLSWNETQCAINEAMQNHDDDVGRGLVGASDVMYIYNALLTRGLLKESNDTNEKQST